MLFYVLKNDVTQFEDLYQVAFSSQKRPGWY
jgi:hypothetical protein